MNYLTQLHPFIEYPLVGTETAEGYSDDMASVFLVLRFSLSTNLLAIDETRLVKCSCTLHSS